MNMSLGVRLRDGRRVGVEWRRRRTNGGTVVHTVLRHEGDLSPEDLERCLAEVADGERILREAKPQRAKRHRAVGA